jgi:2-keto-4-pentenoate hydratase/2-oxohepta-3-ene-1,7-dioic acid hydratase in catechol pathway
MKLLTYDIGTGPRAGVLDGSDILDATTLLGATNTLRDVRALLEFAPTALEQLQLRAPILQPPTVRDHVAFEEHATGPWTRSDNQRMEVWARLPIFYFSNPLRIFGPDEDVPFPAATKQLDYECELATIVDREGNVIATGTVGGGSISEAVRKGYPARWLQPGDVVEIEVEGIGTLRNRLATPRFAQQPLRFTAPNQRAMPEPVSAEELQRVREHTAPPAPVQA